MKRKRHTTDEIIRNLREADQLAAGGDSVPQICQKLRPAPRILIQAYESSNGRRLRPGGSR